MTNLMFRIRKRIGFWLWSLAEHIEGLGDRVAPPFLTGRGEKVETLYSRDDPQPRSRSGFARFPGGGNHE